MTADPKNPLPTPDTACNAASPEFRVVMLEKVNEQALDVLAAWNAGKGFSEALTKLQNLVLLPIPPDEARPTPMGWKSKAEGPDEQPEQAPEVEYTAKEKREMWAAIAAEHDSIRQERDAQMYALDQSAREAEKTLTGMVGTLNWMLGYRNLAGGEHTLGTKAAISIEELIADASTMRDNLAAAIPDGSWKPAQHGYFKVNSATVAAADNAVMRIEKLQDELAKKSERVKELETWSLQVIHAAKDETLSRDLTDALTGLRMNLDVVPRRAEEQAEDADAMGRLVQLTGKMRSRVEELEGIEEAAREVIFQGDKDRKGELNELPTALDHLLEALPPLPPEPPDTVRGATKQSTVPVHTAAEMDVAEQAGRAMQERIEELERVESAAMGVIALYDADGHVVDEALDDKLANLRAWLKAAGKPNVIPQNQWLQARVEELERIVADKSKRIERLEQSVGFVIYHREKKQQGKEHQLDGAISDLASELHSQATAQESGETKPSKDLIGLLIAERNEAISKKNEEIKELEAGLSLEKMFHKRERDVNAEVRKMRDKEIEDLKAQIDKMRERVEELDKLASDVVHQYDNNEHCRLNSLSNAIERLEDAIGPKRPEPPKQVIPNAPYGTGPRVDYLEQVEDAANSLVHAFRDPQACGYTDAMQKLCRIIDGPAETDSVGTGDSAPESEVMAHGGAVKTEQESLDVRVLRIEQKRDWDNANFQSQLDVMGKAILELQAESRERRADGAIKPSTVPDHRLPTEERLKGIERTLMDLMLKDAQPQIIPSINGLKQTLAALREDIDQLQADAERARISKPADERKQVEDA